MSTSDTVRTIIEFLAIIAAIVAMINEDRFIAFEDRVVNFFKEHVDFQCRKEAEIYRSE